MSPLAAFNPPLGPLLAHCHREQVTLHMKEKAFSLTGDDFTVKTVAGLEVCKCKGKVMSLSDKKGKFRVEISKLLQLPDLDSGSSSMLERIANGQDYSLYGRPGQ